MYIKVSVIYSHYTSPGMFTTHILLHAELSRLTFRSDCQWQWRMNTVHIALFLTEPIMFWCVLIPACVGHNVSALLFFRICPSQLLTKSDQKLAWTQGCICRPIWFDITCATGYIQYVSEQINWSSASFQVVTECTGRLVHVVHATLACRLFVKGK